MTGEEYTIMMLKYENTMPLLASVFSFLYHILLGFTLADSLVRMIN